MGLLKSKLLSPLNEIWIKLGEILGRIIAPLIMALVYFLILTPISLLVRAFGKDLLGLKVFETTKFLLEKRKKEIGTMDKQF